MRKRRSYLLLILIMINFLQLLSQNINSENLNDTLLDYLVSKGDFDKSMISANTILIINDILTLKKIEDQKTGIYKFGTLTSHSYFHLLLKGINNYTIVNMRQPYENIVLLLLKYFQENQYYSKEEILLYLKKATELYERDQNVIPWRIEKE